MSDVLDLAPDIVYERPVNPSDIINKAPDMSIESIMEESMVGEFILSEARDAFAGRLAVVCVFFIAAVFIYFKRRLFRSTLANIWLFAITCGLAICIIVLVVYVTFTGLESWSSENKAEISLSIIRTIAAYIAGLMAFRRLSLLSDMSEKERRMIKLLPYAGSVITIAIVSTLIAALTLKANKMSFLDIIKATKYLDTAFIPVYILATVLLYKHGHRQYTFLTFTLLMCYQPIIHIILDHVHIKTITSLIVVSIFLREIPYNIAMVLGLYYHTAWLSEEHGAMDNEKDQPDRKETQD